MSDTTLDVLFRPGGIAVVGASRDPQKLGHSVVRNLVEYGYTGPIYPINPHAADIYERRAYPTVLEAPDPLDLVILAVPARNVAAELDLCGQRGIKAAIVISGGFREVGPEGAAREREVLRIARQYGMRLLGPNGIGIIDTHTPLNTTFVKGKPSPGDIAFLSQSGAICALVIDWAPGAGIGFSRLVSLGNQADIDEAEMLSAIGRDEETRVITAYIEGVSDGRAFVQAASDVARKLPIIALKAGRGSGGAAAVASHTGALAGREEAYDAAFRRSGVLRASTMEELFDWGRALAWQPLPQGNRVAVLTNSGGPGILAVDALEAAGMQLAPLTEETKAFMRKRVPAAASVNNPVDILAGPGPTTYALCLDALLSDPTVDAVVVITPPQEWFAPLSLVEVIAEFNGRGKPVLAVIMGLAPNSEATAVLHRRRVPNFAFPERVGSTLAAMWRRKQWLNANSEPHPSQPPQGCDRLAARAALESAPAGGWLAPEALDALLEAYGVRVPGAGLAADADAAAALATQIGYPVVLKLAAADVVHKSEIGGVALNLDGPEAVRAAFADLLARARAHGVPDAAIAGAFVQKMIPPGVDLIVGIVRDAQFGPLVMAGVGGTQVELLRDVAFELAPLTPQQAGELLDRTGAGRLLAGFRGAPPADRAAVIDAIVRLAQLAHDHPDVAEIEINPLMVMEGSAGAWAVDARARVERSQA
ncbi:MAG: acetate--CoA ligase family protein [Anaerolineae bacterium]|nr:acetate--CoA ligase family protein [Anaerolineae bacterium]